MNLLARIVTVQLIEYGS